MTTQFQLDDLQLTLARYPATANANLQAWDAADEHLLKVIAAEPAANSVLLINDSFGALVCGLRQRQSAMQIHWVADAKTSHLGAQANLLANHLNSDAINWLTDAALTGVSADVTLLKLPKNLNYFAEQLKALSQCLPAGSRLLIGAKAKNINQALLVLIAQHFGPANASLTWKKTRVITAVADGKARPLAAPVRWQTDEQLTLIGMANVFAATKLDIGARFMLQHLPAGDFKQVVDLGCGNGVLGLTAAQRYSEADIHFVDDAYQAVASAQLGGQANNIASERLHFHWDDCLTSLPDSVTADLVLCNPPFHQGEAITDHIAWQMFVDAKKRLREGGMLQVVGNRHLGYHIKLKRLFGNCETVAGNQKFVILRAKR
ncbi:methyltransferase [Shewanella sp. C32]|uniref:Ribosomal RNA large subunit methyltransferase G n=1 Tax=Shewanella electrica TaxID=515560 RepID=A0ABT2FFN7_9GAMM|nr:methyltransferase [Shewanella electrica]MCH1925277.1 methyltransferase [Shewanella electrica]MCS4555102.1 methyltransferase [Shewanella electrica]